MKKSQCLIGMLLLGSVGLMGWVPGAQAADKPKAGEAVNGLKVTLEGPKKIKVGEKFSIKIFLENTSGEALLVEAGKQPRPGNFFGTGRALRFMNTKGEPVKMKEYIRPMMTAVMPSPIVDTVPAKKKIAFAVPFELKKSEDGLVLMRGQTKIFVGELDKITVNLIYTDDGKVDYGALAQNFPPKACWKGKVVSNTLTLELQK